MARDNSLGARTVAERPQDADSAGARELQQHGVASRGGGRIKEHGVARRDEREHHDARARARADDGDDGNEREREEGEREWPNGPCGLLGERVPRLIGGRDARACARADEGDGVQGRAGDKTRAQQHVSGEPRRRRNEAPRAACVEARGVEHG